MSEEKNTKKAAYIMSICVMKLCLCVCVCMYARVSMRFSNGDGFLLLAVVVASGSLPRNSQVASRKQCYLPVAIGLWSEESARDAGAELALSLSLVLFSPR